MPMACWHLVCTLCFYAFRCRELLVSKLFLSNHEWLVKIRFIFRASLVPFSGKVMRPTKAESMQIYLFFVASCRVDSLCWQEIGWHTHLRMLTRSQVGVEKLRSSLKVSLYFYTWTLLAALSNSFIRIPTLIWPLNIAWNPHSEYLQRSITSAVVFPPLTHLSQVQESIFAQLTNQPDLLISSHWMNHNKSWTYRKRTLPITANLKMDRKHRTPR